MEDMVDYFKYVEIPPIFSNIDWTESQSNTPPSTMEFPPLQHVPFQRRRSSSVDLPINPLYLNSSRFTFGNTPIEEEPVPKIGSSSTLEFPLSSSSTNHFNFNFNEYIRTDEPNKATFFPELHRTSYNQILGQQLQKHQKRRRSSSLPPVFKQQQKRVPTPLIFTQIQVTDPRPVQHTQKHKVDAKPIAIERVIKKPQPVKPEETNPAEKQKKMDHALINLNFEDVTVAELKDMLKERGLPNTGKKAILTERLMKVRDSLLHSPTIQGIANMTIHSPLPPTMEDPTTKDQENMNVMEFNSVLDLFPQQQHQERPILSSWDSEWDQDRLDHFLTELV